MDRMALYYSLRVQGPKRQPFRVKRLLLFLYLGPKTLVFGSLEPWEFFPLIPTNPKPERNSTEGKLSSGGLLEPPPPKLFDSTWRPMGLSNYQLLITGIITRCIIEVTPKSLVSELISSLKSSYYKSHGPPSKP